MSFAWQEVAQTLPSEIATTMQNAGIAGAGGAGFPTYAKWDRLNEVDHLLVNHQESEPNYYVDKWLGKEYADAFASLFDAFLNTTLETIVVSAKLKNRAWLREFEAAADPTVYLPEDLPIDPDEESGIIITYTDNKYEYGMETVLLQGVADVIIGQDLPMDHGWLVQNTETLYNVYRTFEQGAPITHKFVHVDGNVPDHRFLKVPIGTPAASVLEAAGRPPSELGNNETLADGGPGWCFAIDDSPDEFGITKRTNCVLVLDEDVVEKGTRGNDRVNVIDSYEWDDNHETDPTATLTPETVRVPLLTNAAFEGVVAPADPIVSPGERVEEGELIATPSSDGVSIAHHASIDGEVTAVTDMHIEICREPAAEAKTTRQPTKSNQ